MVPCLKKKKSMRLLVDLKKQREVLDEKFLS